MRELLPPSVALDASLRGNEYGWSVVSFPHALEEARACGYACLGGQFQFRLDDETTCEMYWLNADANERIQGESWNAYCHRSCSEVKTKFEYLASHTDFSKETWNWPSVQIDSSKNLVFVAYFVTETDLADISVGATRRVGDKGPR